MNPPINDQGVKYILFVNGPKLLPESIAIRGDHYWWANCFFVAAAAGAQQENQGQKG
jgi:hypothetical protein